MVVLLDPQGLDDLRTRLDELDIRLVSVESAAHATLTGIDRFADAAEVRRLLDSGWRRRRRESLIGRADGARRGEATLQATLIGVRGHLPRADSCGGYPSPGIGEFERLARRHRQLELVPAHYVEDELDRISAEMDALAGGFGSAEWRALAAHRVGIDPSHWDPDRGLPANDRIVRATYRLYGDLFLANADLQWAGMASLAGGMLYAGWQDLYVLRHLPESPGPGMPWGIDGLPIGIGDILALLGAAELEWLEAQMLAMQRAVFEDLAWQHLAYAHGGIAWIEALAGEVGPDALLAWREIASGDPERVAWGNEMLLRREQEVVLQPLYDEIRSHHGPIGMAMSYLLTWIAQSPVPGGEPYRDAMRTRAGILDFPVVPPWLDLWPLPPIPIDLVHGNIADFDDRWAWISEHMLPDYQILLRSPGVISALVATPLEQRARSFRLVGGLDYPG